MNELNKQNSRVVVNDRIFTAIKSSFNKVKQLSLSVLETIEETNVSKIEIICKEMLLVHELRFLCELMETFVQNIDGYLLVEHYDEFRTMVDELCEFRITKTPYYDISAYFSKQEQVQETYEIEKCYSDVFDFSVEFAQRNYNDQDFEYIYCSRKAKEIEKGIHDPSLSPSSIKDYVLNPDVAAKKEEFHQLVAQMIMGGPVLAEMVASYYVMLMTFLAKLDRPSECRILRHETYESHYGECLENTLADYYNSERWQCQWGIFKNKFYDEYRGIDYDIMIVGIDSEINRTEEDIRKTLWIGKLSYPVDNDMDKLGKELYDNINGRGIGEQINLLDFLSHLAMLRSLKEERKNLVKLNHVEPLAEIGLMFCDDLRSNIKAWNFLVKTIREEVCPLISSKPGPQRDRVTWGHVYFALKKSQLIVTNVTETDFSKDIAKLTNSTPAESIRSALNRFMNNVFNPEKDPKDRGIKGTVHESIVKQLEDIFQRVRDYMDYGIIQEKTT